MQLLIIRTLQRRIGRKLHHCEILSDQVLYDRENIRVREDLFVRKRRDKRKRNVKALRAPILNVTLAFYMSMKKREKLFIPAIQFFDRQVIPQNAQSLGHYFVSELIYLRSVVPHNHSLSSRLIF